MNSVSIIIVWRSRRSRLLALDPYTLPTSLDLEISESRVKNSIPDWDMALGAIGI